MDDDYLRHIANITHELKTPLHSILSVASLLSSEVDGPLNSEQKKQVAIINRNGENLLSLITSLLEYSAGSTGSNQLSLRALNLNRFIQELTEELRPVAEKKNLLLKLTLTECPDRFFTDKNLLRKIIVNLVSNAIKFSPVGAAIEINVWYETVLNIQIVDSGIGMSPDVKESVFKAFFQVDSSSTRTYGGVGLGLSLVKSACDKLSGSLDLQSEEGKGSIFTIKLPDLFSQAPKIKVLLIEEDESVREAIGYSLKDEGYELIVSSNDTIVKDLIHHEPTLIVLDILGSDKKGPDLISTIRSNAISKEIPILGMSANDDPRERADAFSKGVSDLMLKPFDMSEFLIRVNILLFQ